MKCPEWLLDAMRKGESVKCTANLCGDEEIVCISGFDTMQGKTPFFDQDGTAYSEAEPYKEPEHEFKPFDRVLARDSDRKPWVADIFGGIVTNEEGTFLTVGGLWSQCIPYEGNEALLGTTNSPESK